MKTSKRPAAAPASRETAGSVETPRVRALLHLVAFVIASGLAFMIFHAVAILRDRTVPVLTLARDVGKFMKIADNDLATIDLIPTADARVIFAHDRMKVVGKLAATGLPKGSILTEGNLLTSVLPTGSQIVGLRVERAQRPAQRLLPGESICVSPLPAANACERGEGLTGSFRAVVVEVGPPDPQDAVMVDVLVDPARRSAALSAASGSVLVSLVGD